MKKKTEDKMVVLFVATYIKSHDKLLLLLQLHFATKTLAVCGVELSCAERVFNLFYRRH